MVTLDFSKYPIPTQAYIGGKYVDTKGTEKQSLRSAVNDEVVTSELQWATAADVDIAVAAAEGALDVWAKTPNAKKRDAMFKFASLVRQNGEQLKWMEAVTVGKDPMIGIHDTEFVAELFTYYGGLIEQFHGTVATPHEDGSLEYILKQPFGVVSGITPFNAPLLTFAMKTAPAIAAGNAMVLKASEQNPLSSLFVASLFEGAGFPAGLVNVFTGGAEAGAALASHARIRMLSFTGSIGVGKKIQQAAAASNLKKVTLELGGKSPVIVFDDADLERASQSAAHFLALNGQACAGGTRMYVHEAVAQEMTFRMKAIVEYMGSTLGASPLEPTTMTSPLYNARQKEVVMSFIESGKTEATLLTGGETVGEKGCYVQPTIFVNPAKDAKVLNEEIFGPVLTIATFKDEAEVLALANDSEYALAAYIWTKDLGRALRCSKAIESGSVCVNSPMILDKARPFGGWKQSGQGLENGIAALDDWSQTKSVLLST